MHMSVLSARDICSQIVHGHKLILFVQLLINTVDFLVPYECRPTDLKTNTYQKGQSMTFMYLLLSFISISFKNLELNEFLFCISLLVALHRNQ